MAAPPEDGGGLRLGFGRRRAAGADGSRPISLALQGGGAHGAFQWGVLDRILEDGRLKPGAVTAASAGAMNAVAMVAGLIEGGDDGARAKLEAYWSAVSKAGGRNVFGDGRWGLGLGWFEGNPALHYLESLALNVSPYDFNPLNINPLKDVLSGLIDFAAIRERSPVELFISATAVLTSEARIFRGRELTLDHVLASACLPYLFQAVEIDGEPYWDGGYLANPPLWPLVETVCPHDVLAILLNPLTRPTTPRSSRDIMDRLNEISFNASLAAELRAVAVIQKLLDEGVLKPGKGYKRLRFHLIDADEALGGLAMTTKFNTEWSFLTGLRDKGREAAEAWLEASFDDVGRRSSVDLRKAYL